MLNPGDVVVIDTGMQFEGYWCDFDRNFIVGGNQYLKEETIKAHELIWESTEAGFEVAGAKGSTSSDVFRAMVKTLAIDPETNSTGRMGHGLGL